MRSSSTDRRRRVPADRGTRVRLGILLLLVVLLLVSPAPDLTGALLTDTTQLTTVVSTLQVFPAGDAG